MIAIIGPKLRLTAAWSKKLEEFFHFTPRVNYGDT